MLDLKFRPPLSGRHLEDKLDLGLFYYARLRPHRGLGGATPAEIYFGSRPQLFRQFLRRAPVRATKPSRPSYHSSSCISIPIAGFCSSFLKSSPPNHFTAFPPPRRVHYAIEDGVCIADAVSLNRP